MQVHYHVIPAPSRTTDGQTASTSEKSDRVTRAMTEKEMHQREFEARNELEEDEAEGLVQRIRARL